MAKIVKAAEAPKDVKTFSLANAEVDVASGSFETDDREVLANASAHPWLTVEVEKEETFGAGYREVSVDPDKDVLGAKQGQVAFDKDAIRKTEEAKAENLGTLVGIEAGLKQSKKVVEGDIALTLAADESAPRPGDTK